MAFSESGRTKKYRRCVICGAKCDKSALKCLECRQLGTCVMHPAKRGRLRGMVGQRARFCMPDVFGVSLAAAAVRHQGSHE